MSYITYISFPKKLNAFRFSDIKGREKELGIHYDTTGYRPYTFLFPNAPPDQSNIVIMDKRGSVFKDCFANSFIYEFRVGLPQKFSCRKLEIIQSNLDDETKNRKLEKIALEEGLMFQQIQYDFFNKHLDVGEFVEIYDTWHDHENFSFVGPAIKEEVVTLEDFRQNPIPTNRKMGLESYKLTIHKTK